MGVVYNISALERILELMKPGPLSAEEVCREALAIGTLPGGMAGHLARTLLGSDPRFRELPDSLWALSGDGEEISPLSIEQATFVVVDVETTGFRPPADRVLELGLVKVAGWHIVDEYETLVNPRRPIPGPISSLTGITWDMVAESPIFEEICGIFLEFLGDAIFVAHNAPFDWRFVQSEVSLATGQRLLNPRLCTRLMARRFLPELDRRSLDELAGFFNLRFTERHRALGDARVTAMILVRFLERAAEREITNLQGLFDYLRPAKSRKI